jgi:LmbE family N-acetylglucosaminyl deacetylase
MSETVLVIAAHPDDEVLGCGATIAWHANRGDRAHIVILAEGVTSRSPKRESRSNTKALSRLAGCARRAARVLGAESVTLEQFPDNRLDSVDLLDLIKVVEQYVAKLRPRTVYTHHGGDLNVDHRRVHEAVATACRPLPGAPVRRLLLFEVSSSTEWQLPGSRGPFVPGAFVDVSATLGQKLKALQCYAPEMRQFPHPRSARAVEHLARWRGASVGVDAAEAFVVGREIIR